VPSLLTSFFCSATGSGLLTGMPIEAIVAGVFLFEYSFINRRIEIIELFQPV
jgi:hypothetical protein